MSKTLNTAASSEEVAVEKVATATGKEKSLKVEFLLSPTGKFNLGYNVGEKASFPTLQAQEMIDAGFAKLVK